MLAFGLAAAAPMGIARAQTPVPHHHHHAATAGTHDGAHTAAAHHTAAAGHHAADHHAASQHPQASHGAGHHATDAREPGKSTTAHHPAAHHGADRHPAPHHASVHHPGVVHEVARPIARPAPVAPAAPPAPLPAPPPADKGTNTGLPLPRFAAMRADEVNMRAGPGDRYPIQWVYHRRGLPVEIEREFDVWRLVEDSDGQKGWVHQATLVGERTFVIPGLPPEGAAAAPGEASAKSGDVIGRADARVVARVADQQDARALPGVTLMYDKPDEQSPVAAALRPGTVGTLKQCPPNTGAGAGWCHVVIKGYSGWLPRRVLWGLLPDEAIMPP
ncbi:SH3 domain-containing protein [Tanticharoenia sakaeratensis]|uniref:Aspartyl-tRNA synthetase n=1 Tax=Tanticharoenia sakaeratensis NBRC 103193 TaxID=1231623 RepID=A0A0D6MJ42_9PROT|nr:SH3 domain-containing protein [Tanticharoenia sakaeratensis]GAN53475.1 aspartyl-tRNA synthetase [Tanticharoenia sakaeratensis NBRC 103193]